LGVVPLGSIGMTFFALDLAIVGHPYDALTVPEAQLSIGEFLGAPSSWRIVFDLFMLAVFSGFYIVPLQTLIQERSEASHRSRTIAANNILSAGFMVLSSVALMGISALDWSIPTTFLLLGAVNAIVAIYIYTVIPEFMYRFLCWIVSNLLNKVKVEGHDRIPREGGALMVANHVTYVDWLIIAGACRRPVRLVMHYSFMKYPVFRDLCKRNGVIPIASVKEDPEVLAKAMQQIDDELAAGRVVCIFPEGRLTGDGEMQDFKPGVERILAKRPVPVVPVGLGGLWGSAFSRDKGTGQFARAMKKFRAVIDVRVGETIAPSNATAVGLHAEVAALRTGA
jgi:hypothetical protein